MHVFRMSKSIRGMSPFNFFLPRRLKEELRALAAADQRTLSGYIRFVLAADVARRKPAANNADTANDPHMAQRAGGGYG